MILVCIILVKDKTRNKEKIVETFDEMLDAIANRDFEIEKLYEYIDEQFDYFDSNASDRIIDWAILENLPDDIREAIVKREAENERIALLDFTPPAEEEPAKISAFRLFLDSIKPKRKPKPVHSTSAPKIAVTNPAIAPETEMLEEVVEPIEVSSPIEIPEQTETTAEIIHAEDVFGKASEDAEAEEEADEEAAEENETAEADESSEEETAEAEEENADESEEETEEAEAESGETDEEPADETEAADEESEEISEEETEENEAEFEEISDEETEENSDEEADETVSEEPEENTEEAEETDGETE